MVFAGANIPEAQTQLRMEGSAWVGAHLWTWILLEPDRCDQDADESSPLMCGTRPERETRSNSFHIFPPPQTHFLPPLTCGKARRDSRTHLLRTRRQPFLTPPRRRLVPAAEECVGCPIFLAKRHVGQQRSGLRSAPDPRADPGDRLTSSAITELFGFFWPVVLRLLCSCMFSEVNNHIRALT